MKTISFGIIFCVAAIVLTYSFLILRSGLTDQNNNYQTFNRLVLQSVRKREATRQFPHALVGPVYNSSYSNKCANYSGAQKDEKMSVVDFLYERGLEYSFNQRSIIASTFSIKEYVGSVWQNELLLSLLRESEAEFLTKCRNKEEFTDMARSFEQVLLDTKVIK